MVLRGPDILVAHRHDSCHRHGSQRGGFRSCPLRQPRLSPPRGLSCPLSLSLYTPCTDSSNFRGLLISITCLFLNEVHSMYSFKFCFMVFIILNYAPGPSSHDVPTRPLWKTFEEASCSASVHALNTQVTPSRSPASSSNTMQDFSIIPHNSAFFRIIPYNFFLRDFLLTPSRRGSVQLALRHRAKHNAHHRCCSAANP